MDGVYEWEFNSSKVADNESFMYRKLCRICNRNFVTNVSGDSQSQALWKSLKKDKNSDSDLKAL